MAYIRHLVNQFDIDPISLKNNDSGLSLSSQFFQAFSQHIFIDNRKVGRLFNVTYAEIAPLVGLQPQMELQDIGTFEIHRSRIPTALFRSIIMDMDIMLVLYGAPPHQMERAPSMFFSPVQIIPLLTVPKAHHDRQVFNCLIEQFSGLFRNNLMAIAQDDIDAQLCYKHSYTAFGSTILLFMEMKLNASDNAERLEAMAQFIAEADGMPHPHRFTCYGSRLP